MPRERGSVGIQPASPTAASRWPGHPTGPTMGPLPATQSTADKRKPSAWGWFPLPPPPLPKLYFHNLTGKEKEL